MKDCFDPVIKQILELIDQQLKEVKKAKAPETEVGKSDGSIFYTDFL